MTFNEREQAFLIPKGAIKLDDVGLYSIEIYLTDFENNQRNYSLKLNATCEREPEVISEKFPGVIVPPEYEPTGRNLTGRVKSVDLNGLVTLVFDKIMKPISNFTLIEEGEVLIDEEPKPVLAINAIPGPYSKLEHLALDWEVVNFTSSELTI